jgi:sensor histidine kinase YesM
MQTGSDLTATSMNPLLRFIADSKYSWLRHTLFIVIGLLLAFKGDVGGAAQFRSPAIRNAVLMIDTCTFLFILAMLYVMIWWVVPLLLFRSRIFLFFIASLSIITLVYLVVWFLDFHFLRPIDDGSMKMQHVDLSIIHFIQIGLVGAVLFGSVVGMMVFKKWITDVQRMSELQQTNLKTELEQLKSQVNPHFLFNTLNNLLVLTKTDPEKATQVLLGLSDLLRYQLYDSARERILLSKDIAFMRNLLDLEKIRKNDFDYHIEAEGPIDGLSLPPFLFIPFVENAIKHGASTIGHSYLNLHFKVSKGKLSFRSENSKPPVVKQQIGGIGLKNIQRRLELLYPGKHELEAINTTDKYIVNLTIPL